MNAGPDFLCIGMQKSGTGWLFDQLQHHPDFWMPPHKELHYFDRLFPSEKLARDIRRAQEAKAHLMRKRDKLNWRPLDDRDLSFYLDAETCSGQEPSLERYAWLFRHKGDLLSGDITPAYSTLPEDTITRIVRYLPKLRVVLRLRDPIDRVWSHFSMMHRRDLIKPAAVEDTTCLRALLETPDIHERSFPSKTFYRWSRHIPRDQIRCFFFDDLVSDADALRSSILHFLGADSEKRSGTLEAEFNRKATNAKLTMSPKVKEQIIAYFADEILTCAQLFGGPATGWMNRYGLRNR
jgi:hypothetical protein